MAGYKDTLNLPKTAFPMKGNLPHREPAMLEFWEQKQVYQQLHQAAIDAIAGDDPAFSLHDGPPYANGDIHIGHALNKILKDMILKSKRLAGFAAAYIPGWDCHGLPIELQVEKKYGKRGVKNSDSAFVDHCRSYAQSQIDKQRSDFCRLGVLGDWEQPYKTMDFATEANTIRALAAIHDKGHIYRGVKPVYWSVATGSALAEAEVEYHNKVSDALDVRYAILDRDDLFARFALDQSLDHSLPISVVIWTTTAWTLPASLAVALHPELEYGLVEVRTTDGDLREYIVVAADMLAGLAQRWQSLHITLKAVAKVKGQMLEQLQLQHPFYERILPIVLGSHVTTEAGTGCVHTAPDHGPDDFQLAKLYGIRTLDYVDHHGRYRAEVPLFAREAVHDVSSMVVEALAKNDRLFLHGKINHSYPHCWRTKTPLIFRTTAQWFMRTTDADFMSAALDACAAVRWVPEGGQARIQSMLESSPDWCLSRQRFWGTPLPFIMHAQTGELHPNMTELLEKIAKQVEARGLLAWHELDLASLLGEQASDYIKSTDSLDVWFDSGALHWTVARARPALATPADLFLEGADQHRGWFQTSLKTGIALNQCAPYKAVLTHGFVVDANGHKMSKSKGNIIKPQEVIQKLGADVLRLWVAAADFSAEMSVSMEILDRNVDAYRRIRNTLRFLLANLNDFQPKTDLVLSEQLLPLDGWLLARTHAMQAEVIQAYENYSFISALQKIHHFCNIDLGSFYLDVIKDRQYTCQAASSARRSGQTVLYYALEALVRWVAPILSFTAEEVWGHMPARQQPDSVFLTQWFALPAVTMPDQLTDAFWMQLMAVRNAVNKEIEKARSEGLLKGSLDARVEIFCSADLQEWLDYLGDELRFVLQVSAATVKNFAEQRRVSTDAESMLIRVFANEDAKCERCWHRRPEVGQLEQSTLCQRCVDNVYGEGEDRRFA